MDVMCHNVQSVPEDAFEFASVLQNSDWLQVLIDELSNIVVPDKRHHK